MHGHSRKQNVFIYGCENRYSPDKRLKERVFPCMLNKNAPEKVNNEYTEVYNTEVQKGKYSQTHLKGHLYITNHCL